MAKLKVTSFETLARMAEAKAEAKESEFYRLRSILGNFNWAMFYIILGAREAGKSYAIMEYFVKS